MTRAMSIVLWACVLFVAGESAPAARGQGEAHVVALRRQIEWLGPVAEVIVTPYEGAGGELRGVIRRAREDGFDLVLSRDGSIRHLAFVEVWKLRRTRMAIDRSVGWADLAVEASSRRVAMVLSSGLRFHGTIRAVHPDALEFNVTHSPNRKVQPTGVVLIPRASVAGIEIGGTRSHTILGGIVGSVLGLTLGISLAEGCGVEAYDCAVITAVLSTAGGLTAGALIGSQGDPRLPVAITVRPDSVPGN